MPTTYTPKYEVRKVKSFRGREGYGFNAELLRDGKKVALVMDDAGGGPADFEWVDWKDDKVDVTCRNMKGETHKYKGTKEEAILWAYCSALPTYEFHGMTMYPSPEMFVEDLVNDQLTTASVQRKLKANLVYKNTKGVYQVSFKGRTLEQILELKAQLKKKYPEAEFVNDMPLERQVAILTGKEK